MKLSKLMTEYFEASPSSHAWEDKTFKISLQLPVSPFKDEWEIVASPNRLMRDYEFSNPQQMQSFINEILEYQESVYHHAKMTVEHLKVRIEVWTHDVDDVTEVDKEFAVMSDRIYEDVQYYEF